MWIPIMAASVGSWCIFFALTAGEMVDSARVKRPEKKEFSEARRSDLRQRSVTAPAVISIVTGLFIGVSSTFFHSAITRGSWKSPMSVEELALNLLLGILFALISLVIAPVLANLLIKGDGSPSDSAKDPFRIYSAAREYLSNDGRGTVKLKDLKINLSEWNSKIHEYAMNVDSRRSSGMLNVALEEGILKEGIGFKISAVKVFWIGATTFFVRFAFFWIYLILSTAGPVVFLISQWRVAEGDYWKLIFVALAGLLLNALTVLIYSIARGGRALKWYSVYVSAVEEARCEIERAEEAVNSVAGECGVSANIESSLAELTRAVERLAANSVSYSLRPRAD